MKPRRGCRLVRAALLPAAVAAATAALSQPASAQMMDDHVYSLVLFDLAEYRRTGEGNPISWDMLGWVGGDVTRFWLKSEGNVATTGGGGDIEVQGVYSRLIAPYWELQVGLRMDLLYGAGETNARAHAVLGLQGLAPYWFELEPTVFVSQEGHVSGRLTATYDLLITQRLVGQPRLETSVAIQDAPEFGVGGGLNDVELGFRLRYEVRREFAPYVGVNWRRLFAGTADLARAAGAPASDLAAVAGIRAWF
jgi:copper resistance protein B